MWKYSRSLFWCFMPLLSLPAVSPRSPESKPWLNLLEPLCHITLFYGCNYFLQSQFRHDKNSKPHYIFIHHPLPAPVPPNRLSSLSPLLQNLLTVGPIMRLHPHSMKTTRKTLYESNSKSWFSFHCHVVLVDWRKKTDRNWHVSRACTDLDPWYYTSVVKLVTPKTATRIPFFFFP